MTKKQNNKIVQHLQYFQEVLIQENGPRYLVRKAVLLKYIHKVDDDIQE